MGAGSVRGRAPAVLLAALVMLSVGLVVGALAVFLRSSPANEVGRDAAAAVLGVRPDDVFLTADGALSVVSEGGLLSLVLVQPSDAGTPDQIVLGASELDSATLLRGHEQPSPDSPTAGGGTVLCPPDLGLERSWYVFGRRVVPGAISISVTPPAGGGGAQSAPLPVGGELSNGAYLFAMVANFDGSTPYELVFTPQSQPTRDAASVAVPLVFPDAGGRRAATPAGCWMHGR